MSKKLDILKALNENNFLSQRAIAKKLVDELYAMHLTEEEILRLASEILLGQMDN